MNSQKSQTQKVQTYQNNFSRFERLMSFGDALFETIYFKDKFLYAWQYHYQRLKKGAKALYFILPSEDELLNIISAEIKAIQFKEAAIKLIIFRSSQDSVGYLIGSNQTEAIVFVREYQRNNSNKSKNNLRVCNHRLSLNPYINQFKHTNRLDQVIARNETIDEKKINQGNNQDKNQDNNQGGTDGIMRSQDNYVIETTSANLLIYRNDKFYTPQLKTYGIKGVMREIVLEAMIDLEIKIQQHRFKLPFLKQASNVMFMNSLIAIQSIQSIENYFETKDKNIPLVIQSIIEKAHSIEFTSAVKLS